jgi:hypothetical protein
MKKLLIILLVAIGLISCGKRHIDTHAFYFPYATFIEPKIYQYQTEADSNEQMYWYLKTEAKNTDTTFVATIYNSNFKITSVYFNSITEQGAYLKQMFINLDDSASIHQCTIKENTSYLWKVKPKQSFFLSFSMSNPAGSESEEVITERIFEETKEKINFQGKDYPCIIIQEKSNFNHVRTNRTSTEEQERYSYFAEGIGLVRFETFNANGNNTVQHLKKIMTEQEWNDYANRNAFVESPE